ncbi:MAG: hypothetical protein LKF62_08045, partial [Solobacterium sp.]|nr:hypothetical protein [Solobacterium sp.]
LQRGTILICTHWMHTSISPGNAGMRHGLGALGSSFMISVHQACTKRLLSLMNRISLLVFVFDFLIILPQNFRSFPAMLREFQLTQRHYMK